MLETYLQVKEHLQILLLEEVRLGVFLVQWTDEEGVDAEEIAELLIEERLLNVGSG